MKRYLVKSKQQLVQNARRQYTNQSKMKAVVCHGPKDYKIEEVNVPQITSEDEVIIEVERVGICAGDSKCFAGAPHFWSLAYVLFFYLFLLFFFIILKI